MKHNMIIPSLKEGEIKTEKEAIAGMERILSERASNKVVEGNSSEPIKDTPPQAETRIETLGDCWRIEGINYRGKTEPWELSKQFLKGTQNELITHTLKSRQNNGFGIESIAFHQSLFTALYNDRKNSQSEEIRKFIDDEMKPRWLLTSTRISYQPKGKDLIIHNYGLPDKEEISIDFVGNYEWVKDSQTPQIYQALLGTNDLKQINKVYQWLNKFPAYLWRLNSKPQNVDERVAWLSAVSDGVSLDCSRGADYIGASLGVRRAKKILA